MRHLVHDEISEGGGFVKVRQADIASRLLAQPGQARCFCAEALGSDAAKVEVCQIPGCAVPHGPGKHVADVLAGQEYDRALEKAEDALPLHRWKQPPDHGAGLVADLANLYLGSIGAK